MRTHLGCTGRIDLGQLSQATQQKLEKVQATWLEFTPSPASLVVRHVQPDDVPALREIAGELLEFLSLVADSERKQLPGGALYFLDEQNGQSVRIKVWEGGFTTFAWAQPDYTSANWERYRGQRIPLVFDAYQRLNGTVKLQAPREALEEIRAVIERPEGLYPQGNFDAFVMGSQIEIRMVDVNASVLPLLKALQAKAEPPSSLDGEIDVSSFRSGDVEDYCRFVVRRGEAWVARPALWPDVPQAKPAPPQALEPAA
ncbi:MAG: hypothetical protein LAN62_02910 [Acidobacteriia bacterium]|nr:hypothetical protein [Terriglobia bacterium]